MIVELFLNFNFWLESRTESRPKEQRTLISKVVLNGLKLVCTYMVYGYLSLLKKLGMIRIKPLIDDGKLPIVSLTTFPARIDNLWMVLYCIFRQSVRPAKIVVTLIEEEMPGGNASLAPVLRYFESYGVEFLFEKENLRPHNKYFYCRQKYNNRDVITIDDDLLYYSKTIERLLELHKRYPNCVCTNRGTLIKTDESGFLSSRFWPTVLHDKGPSLDIIALGYSAVFYPATFQSPLLYDVKLIKDLSLGTDDLWLRAIETVEGIGVVNGGYYAHPMTLPTSQAIALQKRNCAIMDNGNDINWHKLNCYFGLYDLLKNHTDKL
ncbi:MAG: hypothetical protein NC388_09375 [Clostridium sp.]|nr:hypothetical protein [Clostridium sp.]